MTRQGLGAQGRCGKAKRLWGPAHPALCGSACWWGDGVWGLGRGWGIGTRVCAGAQRRFALPHRPGANPGPDLVGDEKAL